MPRKPRKRSLPPQRANAVDRRRLRELRMRLVDVYIAYPFDAYEALMIQNEIRETINRIKNAERYDRDGCS